MMINANGGPGHRSTFAIASRWRKIAELPASAGNLSTALIETDRRRTTYQAGQDNHDPLWVNPLNNRTEWANLATRQPLLINALDIALH